MFYTSQDCTGREIVCFVWFMVFNATFNNNSVISWRLVLLVQETRVPEKTTDLSQVTEQLYRREIITCFVIMTAEHVTDMLHEIFIK